MNSPTLTSSLIASALGLSNTKQNKFINLTSDSRTVSAGSCFIALVGEQSDGHAYIEKALASGASGIICRQGTKVPTDSAEIFYVADTLEAYRKISGAWRALFTIPVVAVAGSAGKTTTKELVAAVLRGKWRNVLQTQASQNGFQGIPATLMQISPRHEVAVIEVGIDEPHAMAEHLKLVRPTHGLLTSIGEEHLEKLIDIATVAREEGELFRDLAERGGVLCINCDDPLIFSQSQKYTGGKRLHYSLEKSADLAGKVGADQKTLVVQGLGSFPLPLPGIHNALNTLAAIAIGNALGLSAEEINTGLRSFTPPSGRSELHLWRGNIRVFCDTYNANPLSVKTALALLKKEPGARAATWACLGDMLELGDNEEGYHRSLAELLQSFDVDHVLLFGPKMKWLADELSKLRFKGKFAHFETIEDISEALQRDTKPNDLVLIKGSRGMKMERIWASLSQSS